MLSIQIDDPELEKSIKLASGGNDDLIGSASVEFIHSQRLNGMWLYQLNSLMPEMQNH